MLILAASPGDGRYWGCAGLVPPGSPRDRVGVSRSAGASGRSGGLGRDGRCGVPRPGGCDRGRSRARTRSTRQWPRWRCSLGDGAPRRCATHEGYFASRWPRPCPGRRPAVNQLRAVGFDRFPMVVRVTYLDGEGRPVAASVLDGTLTDRRRPVAGLPLTEDAYPSLAGGL